jgi:hypothetical protein
MPIVTKSIIVNGIEKIVEIEDENMNEGDDDFFNETQQNTNRNKMNSSAFLTDRPRTGDQRLPELNVSFSISSRLPLSPQETIHTRNPVTYKESQEDQVATSTATLVANSVDIQSLIIDDDTKKEHFILPSELEITPIIDNPIIQKSTPLKFEPKLLPFTNVRMLKAETLEKMNHDDFQNFLDLVKASTNVPLDKSASSIKLKLHLMNFVGQLCCDSVKLSNSFMKIELYKDLLTIIKTGHSIEMKMKATRVMAIMFNRSNKLDPSKELTEILQATLDTISSNRKDLKFKQILLASMGEIIYFIICQELLNNNKLNDNWSIPALCFIVLIRSIGDDLVINHTVCKVILNIASKDSQSTKKLLFGSGHQSELIMII